MPNLIILPSTEKTTRSLSLRPLLNIIMLMESIDVNIEELWPRVFVPKPINNPISRGGRGNCRFYWWADVGMSKCQVKLIIWWRRTYQLQLFQIIYPKVKSRSAIKIKKVKNYWVEQVHCWLNVVLLQFFMRRFENIWECQGRKKRGFLGCPQPTKVFVWKVM